MVTDPFVLAVLASPFESLGTADKTASGAEAVAIAAYLLLVLAALAHVLAELLVPKRSFERVRRMLRVAFFMLIAATVVLIVGALHTLATIERPEDARILGFLSPELLRSALHAGASLVSPTLTVLVVLLAGLGLVFAVALWRGWVAPEKAPWASVETCVFVGLGFGLWATHRVLRPDLGGEALGALVMAIGMSLLAAWVLNNKALKLVAAGQREALLQRLSHDLRNPAAAVRSLAEALERGDVEEPAERQRFLALLRGEAERLAVGLDRMLRAARGQATIEVEPVELDLEAWARAVHGRWRTRLPGLEVSAAAEGPVRADPERLDEAVDALLDNAMRHGGPKVRLDARCADGWVEVIVEDDGPGVPQAVYDRLVRRLTGEPPRSGEEGAGELGLWTVSLVAAAHGGGLCAGWNRNGLRFPAAGPSAAPKADG